MRMRMADGGWQLRKCSENRSNSKNTLHNNHERNRVTLRKRARQMQWSASRLHRVAHRKSSSTSHKLCRAIILTGTTCTVSIGESVTVSSEAMPTRPVHHFNAPSHQSPYRRFDRLMRHIKVPLRANNSSRLGANKPGPCQVFFPPFPTGRK